MSPDGLGASGTRVVSAVPGRIRLRATHAEGRRRLASLADELSGFEEVASVEVRASSASVLVRFDPNDAREVADRLLSLGVDLRVGAAPPPPASAAAAAGWANAAVARRLDGTDLRTLVPLGLGLMAARRAMQGEDRLSEAPWHVLAWYATQTFWKFQAAPAPGRAVNSEEE